MPETPPVNAFAVAQRLRQAVAAMPVRLETGGEMSVTVSLGLSWLNATDAGIEPLLARADAALYRAKHAGRNRSRWSRGSRCRSR
ncbi:diguanylate cyclase [Azospirillum sp. INR13]|uniref:diguanylate cyclase n=1 Tax=Azospirillum sp. INR13 TaxID=2596919 RepID=UPI002102032E|nr:diguanylate cyclase [Azospirillum sp. INR13]